MHSRLLERAVKLSDKYGAGSLTALPIIETQDGEVSAYIPTNVISITDGQIYLLPNLFASGQLPAVDVGISVSRVGGAAQIKAMRSVGGTLKLDLAQFRELESFAQLGTELDPATQKQLDRGYRVLEILKQDEAKPWDTVDEILTIFAVTKGYLDAVPVKKIRELEEKMKVYFHKHHKNILENIINTKTLGDEKVLGDAVNSFVKHFLETHHD